MILVQNVKENPFSFIFFFSFMLQYCVVCFVWSFLSFVLLFLFSFRRGICVFLSFFLFFFFFAIS